MTSTITSATSSATSTNDLFDETGSTDVSLNKQEIIWLSVIATLVVLSCIVVTCVLCRCKARRLRGLRRSRGTSVDDGRNVFPTWNKNAPLPVLPVEAGDSNVHFMEARREQAGYILQQPTAAHLATTSQAATRSAQEKDGLPEKEDKKRSNFFSGWSGLDKARLSLIGRAL